MSDGDNLSDDDDELINVRRAEDDVVPDDEKVNKAKRFSKQILTIAFKN